MAGNGELAMSWAEWSRFDGIGLAELVRTGEISAQQVVAQSAAAVNITNPHLDAVLEVFDDVVADPDVNGPNRDGLLYGVPFFLKDLGSRLIGRKRESGSKLYRDYVADVTDPYVENALSAGLIPLGRSTTPEFGLTFDTSTDYLGGKVISRNPWRLDRTPGGSSGGTGALVAAGVTPLSMSSDGGGSTRYPATFCAMVGLKATRGLFPPATNMNQLFSRYGIEGVVSRTVRDTAAAYDYLTRVPNGGTFIPVRPYAGSYLDDSRRSPGQLRIALSVGGWGFDEPIDPEVEARTRDAAEALQALGHSVDEIDESAIGDFAMMRENFKLGWLSNSALYIRECQSRGLDPQATLCPMTYKYGLTSLEFDRWTVHQTIVNNPIITRQWGRFFEQYDLLLCPTCAVKVPEANGPYSLLCDEPFEPWFNRLHAAIRYTYPANETGLPAISLPAGLSSEDSPIGVQLYGSFLREDLLLQVATQLEAAKPEWFNQIPPHHVSNLA